MTRNSKSEGITNSAVAEIELETLEADSEQGQAPMADTAAVRKNTGAEPYKRRKNRSDLPTHFLWYVRELTPPKDAFEKTEAEHLLDPPEFPKLD